MQIPGIKVPANAGNIQDIIKPKPIPNPASYPAPNAHDRYSTNDGKYTIINDFRPPVGSKPNKYQPAGSYVPPNQPPINYSPPPAEYNKPQYDTNYGQAPPSYNQPAPYEPQPPPKYENKYKPPSQNSYQPAPYSPPPPPTNYNQPAQSYKPPPPEPYSPPPSNYPPPQAPPEPNYNPRPQSYEPPKDSYSPPPSYSRPPSHSRPSGESVQPPVYNQEFFMTDDPQVERYHFSIIFNHSFTRAITLGLKSMTGGIFMVRPATTWTASRSIMNTEPTRLILITTVFLRRSTKIATKQPTRGRLLPKGPQHQSLQGFPLPNMTRLYPTDHTPLRTVGLSQIHTNPRPRTHILRTSELAHRPTITHTRTITLTRSPKATTLTDLITQRVRQF